MPRVVPPPEIDLATETEFRQALAAAGDGDLVVACGDLRFVDSSGVRALLDAQRRRAASGHRVILEDCGPILARLLEVTETASLFDRRSSSDAA